MMDRRTQFLDVTMKIVADRGFADFSMKQVTNMVGCSEALLYRYFPSKADLFSQCFHEACREIDALFAVSESPHLTDQKSIDNEIRSIWERYFRFLIQNKHHTIFYYEYRNSEYARLLTRNVSALSEQYAPNFVKRVQSIRQDGRFEIYDRVDFDIFWTYVLDVSAIFAKRIIQGSIPNTDQAIEQIWTLLQGGLSAILTFEEE